MRLFVNTLRLTVLCEQANLLSRDAKRHPGNKLLKWVAEEGHSLARWGKRLVNKQLQVTAHQTELNGAIIVASPDEMPGILREVYRMNQAFNKRLKNIEVAAQKHEAELTEWRMLAFKVSLLTEQQAQQIAATL